MKLSVIFLAIAVVLTSCTYFQLPNTLDRAKADLECIKCDEGIRWAEISEKFGSPDVTPMPEPGTRLARNARLYKGKTIIFYTELQEVKEGEKIRFREVVTSIEVCKKK
jgi:hypothetical protein